MLGVHQSGALGPGFEGVGAAFTARLEKLALVDSSGVDTQQGAESAESVLIVPFQGGRIAQRFGRLGDLQGADTAAGHG